MSFDFIPTISVNIDAACDANFDLLSLLRRERIEVRVVLLAVAALVISLLGRERSSSGRSGEKREQANVLAFDSEGVQRGNFSK